MASHGKEMYAFPPNARWNLRVGDVVVIWQGKYCGHSGPVLNVIPPGGKLKVWSYDGYMVTVFALSCALVADAPPDVPGVQDIRLGDWVVVRAGSQMGGQGEVTKVMPRSGWVRVFDNTVYRFRKTSLEVGVKPAHDGILVADVRGADGRLVRYEGRKNVLSATRRIE
jgi:ribosomal protein L24